MSISKRLMNAGSVLVLSSLFAGHVYAEEMQSKAPEKDVQEIIITAQKTRTVPSKTPIALSVFSGDQLKQAGVVDINNLQNIAPGLTIGSQAHGVEINIRGVQTTDITSKGDQDIVFTVDGAPIGRPQEMGQAFFDLERVEVLRGPQGTLYGRSSTGGAINVITNKPKNFFDASGALEIGDYNTRRGEFMVNVPITSTFAVRAAGAFNNRDGFEVQSIGNTQTLDRSARPDDEDNMTGRLTAQWKFAEDGTATLTGTFGHVGGFGGGAILYDSYLHKRGKAAHEVYYNPYGGSMNDNFRNYNLNVEKDFGAVHFGFVGAHQEFQGHDLYQPNLGDPAAQAGGAYNWANYRSNVKTDSLEARLSNTSPQKLEWVIGISGYREWDDEHDQNWQTAVAPGNPNWPNCTLPAPNLDANCSSPNPGIVGVTIHASTGIFGQLNYHWDDKLTLTLGLRESSDYVIRRATVAAGPFPFFSDAAMTIPCGPPNDCIATPMPPIVHALIDDTGQQSATALTYRVGFQYQLAEHQMVYGSVATGYKAGGFNDYEPATGTTGIYDPAKLTSYEIGYKGQPLPNLQYNTSFYYYDYQKYQVTSAALVAFPPPFILIYTKTAPLTMYGWENEVTWRATGNDTFNASLSLEHAEFGQLGVGFLLSNPYDWTGRAPDAAPEVSGTFAYDHRWDLASGANVHFKVSSKISGEYYYSNLGGTANFGTGQYSEPPTQYTQKGYTRSDINISYTAPDGKYTVSGYVRNLEDRVQLNGGPALMQAGFAQSGTVRVTAPRTMGVRVSMDY
jgi:iron complex outermembrane receptor protein